MMLQKVTTNFWQTNQTTQWKEHFNQATFFNYDPNVSVIIASKWVLPPALVDPNNGQVYPTYLEVSLHVGEFNTTEFNLDLQNSDSADLQIIYTQYVDLPKEAFK